MPVLPLLLLQLAPFTVSGTPARPPARETAPATIATVTLAPLFHQPFQCSEHPEGAIHGLGDAIGTDCVVTGAEGMTQASGFFRQFRTDGRTNADWYGWRAEVHAPIDAVVTQILINPRTNLPGTMGRPPASQITFRTADGTMIVYAHIMDPRVKVGDAVTAGQVVALDGNNGMARMPHVHVGAWRGTTPLQIRWDLRAEGKVPALVG